MVLTEREFEFLSRTVERPRENPDDTVYLPFVPSFGWRPGQSDFPVSLISAADAFPATRFTGRTHTRDVDLFPHVEVLVAPERRTITPARVVALIVIVGGAILAGLTVFNDAESPVDEAALAPTATEALVTATPEDGEDPATRQPQPGFGGALPGRDDTPEPTPAAPSATSTPSETPRQIPTAVSILPGSGVVTVSARAEDTLVSIAEKFDVAVSSLLWSNDFGDPTTPLGDGTVVRVPREDGVIHEVGDGDTIELLAALYAVEAKDIVGYAPNDIESDRDLTPGDLILVPGGRVADRGRIDEYSVQSGDTLFSIANYYGLQPQTLVWANELPDPSLIHVSQVLVVPPGDGALIHVVEGDTIDAIADRFGVDPADIHEYGFNGLSEDSALQVGQALMVPGDFLPPLPENSPIGAVQAGDDVEGPSTGTFIWPTDGRVSQEFHTGHLAVDIANEAWTPVNAMDGGIVIFAGWSDYGLGYTVGIDHGNGFQTWYGHFAGQPYVEVGQIIWQGGYLGPMGSTGKSTGPHLHLVLLKDGVYLNPLEFLQ